MSMELSTIIQMVLVVFLIASAIGVSITRNLFLAVIVFMGYSSIMAIIWVFLESPDLAITEAAVGAGVDSVLFFLTLKKVHALKGTREG
ncbi:hydrogenase subunit MbhD domain-containing protein [Anaerotignum lactatifermentans]